MTRVAAPVQGEERPWNSGTAPSAGRRIHTSPGPAPARGGTGPAARALPAHQGAPRSGAAGPPRPYPPTAASHAVPRLQCTFACPACAWPRLRVCSPCASFPAFCVVRLATCAVPHQAPALRLRPLRVTCRPRCATPSARVARPSAMCVMRPGWPPALCPAKHSRRLRPFWEPWELGWPLALCHAKHSHRATVSSVCRGSSAGRPRCATPSTRGAPPLPSPPPCVVRPGWPLALCHTKHSRCLRPIWGCRGSSAGRSRCATPSTRVAPPSPLCVADHRLAARAVPHQALASRPIPLRVA